MYPEIVAFVACLSLGCCPSLCGAVWIDPTHALVQDGHSIGPTHAPVPDGHLIGPKHAPVQDGHSIDPTHAPGQDGHSVDPTHAPVQDVTREIPHMHQFRMVTR